MNFEIQANMPSVNEVIERFGLDENGIVQKTIDQQFIHFMRLKMPLDSGVLMANTRSPRGGLVQVQTPYAHYQNEGILYVDSITGKGAFHDPISGRFWSRPNTKKIASNRKLTYHGGPNRGAHFVERTITENQDDIAKSAQEVLNRL